jgi:prepilin-type N-terminal cleavage/methylation domain-containing protein
MKPKHSAGFTLMEILIVMAIIVALMAILLPSLFNQQNRTYIQQAGMKIKQIEGELQAYSIENKGYPTTEQGLFALIYIPDNVGAVPFNPAAMGQAGMNGTIDPTGGMGGGAVSVGPEMFNTPQPDPMMTGGVTASGTGTMPMMNDPTGMSGTAVGSGTAGMVSAWTQPIYNPQLYTQQRKRAAPFIENPKDLIDPWGQPYRYDNSMAYYGVNQTGQTKPAIWSAGPDKQDNTDDDIRNWDPVEAQQLLAVRQQQGGMGMGQTGMMTADPTGMMGGGMPMQSGATGMPTMPMQPGATGMPAMPMQPGATGMPTMPMQPGTTGMPAQPNFSPGMPLMR